MPWLETIDQLLVGMGIGALERGLRLGFCCFCFEELVILVYFEVGEFVMY